MKLAYIVIPWYDSNVTDGHNLLPHHIDKYKRDVAGVQAILESRGFTVVTDLEHVSAEKLKTKITEYIAQCADKTDVFTFVYMGHAQNEIGVRHAALRMSDNVKVSSMWLDDVLNTAKCTVYKLFEFYTNPGDEYALAIPRYLCSNDEADDIFAPYVEIAVNAMHQYNMSDILKIYKPNMTVIDFRREFNASFCKHKYKPTFVLDDQLKGIMFDVLTKTGCKLRLRPRGILFD